MMNTINAGLVFSAFALAVLALLLSQASHLPVAAQSAPAPASGQSVQAAALNSTVSASGLSAFVFTTIGVTVASVSTLGLAFVIRRNNFI